MKEHWIKVIDKLPKHENGVLIYGPEIAFDIAFYSKFSKKWIGYESNTYEQNEVTHWQELEKPKKKTIAMFENTFFGKVYKTRDGRRAVYNNYMIGHQYLLVDKTDRLIKYNMDGTACDELPCLDIIGEWEE